MRRTKEEAEKTRQHILENAIALFEQHGYGRTSMNDIAKASGVSRGAIYWYFAAKSDIILAMGNQYLHAPLQLFKKQLTQTNVWENFMHEVIRHQNALQNDSTQRRFKRLITLQISSLMGDNALVAPLQRYHSDWLAMIKEVINLAVAQHELPQNLDKDWAFWQLSCTLMGICFYLSNQFMHSYIDQPHVEQVIRNTFNMIRNSTAENSANSAPPPPFDSTTS